MRLPDLRPRKSWPLSSGKGGGKLIIHAYKCPACGDTWREIDKNPPVKEIGR